MKILFLQLSDMHFHKKEDIDAVNKDKLLKALNILGSIDECIIILNGDLVKAGEANEYKLVESLVGFIINRLKENMLPNKKINVLAIPGNHDLDLTGNELSGDDIISAYKSNTIEDLLESQLKLLNNFYGFSKRNGCFTKDLLMDKKVIKLGDTFINILLLNSAPFSLKGSTNTDKGMHYLNLNSIENMKFNNERNLTIAIMHHNTEWFNNPIKEKLNKLFRERFSIVFTGHEHDGISENKWIDNEKNMISIQGYTLSGDKIHEKGFMASVYDTESKRIVGYSFKWNGDCYKHKMVLDEYLPIKGNEFNLSCEFVNYIKHDDNKKLLNDYFICPTLSYKVIDDTKEVKIKKIESIEELVKVIYEHKKVMILGDNNCGKTTLAKMLYDYWLQNDYDKIPILLTSEDLRNKRIERIVKYAFDEQYDNGEENYPRFEQVPTKNKIVLIDDVDKVEKRALDKLLKYLDTIFGITILFSQDRLKVDIQKQVQDALTEKNILNIDIKPFLYSKRRLLIKKTYTATYHDDIEDVEKEIEEINRIIHSQVRFFRLDPEFIVNFVCQYKDKLNLNSNDNIFNIVYENNIKSRLIEQISDNNEVPGVFTVLQELAFHMHFEKLASIAEGDIIDVVSKYNKDYRQNVQWRSVLDGGSKANILISLNSGRVKFKDKNLLAYFVAQALNRKYFDGDAEDQFEYLLRNLCFSINSDIVLFLALITNNRKIIQGIMDCAQEHFKKIEEFSFDTENIKILCEANLNVKNTLPDNKEKQKRQYELIEHEENVKSNELIELADEYDYSEDEVHSFENQILKSLKYIELICKILPSFSYNMKAEQQEDLVRAIYSYPNKFIYQMFKDIDENFEENVNILYNKVAEIRKQSNLAELQIEKITDMFKQTAITLLISLYQTVASTCTTKQTLNILNDNMFIGNSNTKLLNLMMVAQEDNIKSFSKKAIKLNDQSKLSIYKGLVKYTVRDYFLCNEVKFVGDGQALMDRFFGQSEVRNNDKKKLKINLAQNRIKRNHI